MNLTHCIPKWVLIVRPKIPAPNAPEFICSSPKVLDFNEKRLHWASVVRAQMGQRTLPTKLFFFANLIFTFPFFCVAKFVAMNQYSVVPL